MGRIRKSRAHQARGIVMLRRCLHSVVKDNSSQPRRLLKGSEISRVAAVTTCRNWLAAMRLEVPDTKPLPDALRPVIADVRRTAMDKRLTANVRKTACGRLLRIAGFTFAPYSDEPIDRLITQHCGEAQPPELSESRDKKFQRKRIENRNQSLLDIKRVLAEDIAAGRVTTLAEVIEHLRLPEMDPREVKKETAEVDHSAAITKALAALDRRV